MKRNSNSIILTTVFSVFCMFTPALVHGQEESLPASEDPSFESASQDISARLQASLEELAALRDQMAADMIPRSRELRELEGQLTDVRKEYQQVNRLLDTRTLDLTNIQRRIESREDTTSYLSNLLAEYIRNFETRLHISEIQRYQAELEAARLAPDNDALDTAELFTAQSKVLTLSLERLEEMLGGARFPGSAVDSQGIVRQGEFLLVGPSAIFKAEGDSVAGSAEERLGSTEPTEVSYSDPLLGAEAAALVSDSVGIFPFDPTLGNAHKVEATEETLFEHIEKAGPVGVPIIVMAALALVVALGKWTMFLFVRRPSKRAQRQLIDAMSRHDVDAASKAAGKVGGPTGRMLLAGFENREHAPQLVEEIMFEHVMETRTRLSRWLPFIAICAASAPLLGLLGTVTGIIETFKMITIFGSGDVKSLSGGISAALITTEFGLVVAIPSLILHAWLSRKAKGFVDGMERAAVGFMNQLGKTPFFKDESTQSESSNGSTSGYDGEMRDQFSKDIEHAVQTTIEKMLAGGILLGAASSAGPVIEDPAKPSEDTEASS